MVKPELLGRRGYWLLSSRQTMGWTVKVPVLVIGFGRGKVKVQATLGDGRTVEKFVPENRLQVRTHFGRTSKVYRCKHEGCPVQYVNPYRIETHEAEKHIRCKCGRHFTAHGLAKHLGSFTRRGIKHP